MTSAAGGGSPPAGLFFPSGPPETELPRLLTQARNGISKLNVERQRGAHSGEEKTEEPAS